MFSTKFDQLATRRGTSQLGEGATGMGYSRECKVSLPRLPSGIVTLNTVILRADVGTRLFRVEEFEAQLEASGALKDVLSMGC